MATAVQLTIIVSFSLSVCPSAIYLDTDTCLWLQNIVSAITSLILILCCNSNTLIKYLSLACKTYNLPSSNSHPFPIILFCILIIYPFVPLLYIITWISNITIEEAFHDFRKYYLYIPVSAVEVVITICCFIASRAYCDINNRLRKYLQLNFEVSTLNSVQNLLTEYIAVCKFARNFARVFSPHFLNSFTYLILRMIFFTVSFIQFIKDKEYIQLMFYALYAAYLVFRLLIICFSCQNIHREVGAY